jgi:uncharacterized protein YecE (DUF72 family)
MRKWWIGCSGFHYKNWRQKFYPPRLPAKKWFEYYCEFFNTVELNVSFYRFPTLPSLKAWYDRSPPEFRFAMKAPRLITHFKRFHQAKREAGDFYSLVAEGLRDKLGPILFQMHPATTYTSDNLERILETLDPSFVNVLEFRHPSWWNRDVTVTLKNNNVTFCSISYPSLPADVVRTSNVIYYRFHGVPELYKSSYSDESLTTISTAIKNKRDVADVYAYFNNDIDVEAIYNARTLQSMVGVSPSSAAL